MNFTFLFLVCNFFSFAICCENLKWSIFEKNQTAILILARGGSKGIPLKNLAKIGNKTLLRNSLEVILKVSKVNSVWVSTDNNLILKEAANIDKRINIHWRSEKTATDSASSVIAVQEFLHLHPQVDKIILIQLTSPFIKIEYLKQIINEFQNFECVFSVTRSFKLRWQRFFDGRIVPINFNPKLRPRRQDWDGEMVENGMFYAASRNIILKGLLQTEECNVIEIAEEDSLEIDNLYHLYLANKINEY